MTWPRAEVTRELLRTSAEVREESAQLCAKAAEVRAENARLLARFRRPRKGWQEPDLPSPSPE